MMADRTTLRRALVVGLAALAAALGLFTVLPASATHVTPVEKPGNATCPPGTTELKVEPVTDGTFTDGTLTVTIDVRDTAQGQVFDWTSTTISVDVVIVKGGNASNVYTYPNEAMTDTGLHAPANRSGSWAGLSHISFCYDVEAPTTTTSTTTTTTTAPPTTTTTTAPPTTTSTTAPPTTTSTTAPPTSTTTPSTTTPTTPTTAPSTTVPTSTSSVPG